MNKRVDQRIRMTRSLLKDALVRLMQQQHISKISVSALCAAAGINRSTFYMHYTNQYDLLSKVEQEVMGNLISYLERQDLNSSNPISGQVLTGILDYVKEDVELFKALLSENCDFDFQKNLLELAQMVSDQVNETLDLRTQEYVKTFGLNGVIAMLQKWMQGGMVEPSAQMAEFILRVLYLGINGINGQELRPGP